MPAFDYTIQTPDAFTSVAQGFQLGSAIRAQQEQRALLEQQQQAAMAQEQKRQEELTRFYQLPADQVTPQEVFRVSQFMPADKINALKDMMSGMTQEGQKQEKDFVSRVSSAYLANQPEVAKKALMERVDALRNSGKPDQANALQTIAEVGSLDPGLALKSIIPLVSALPDGKQLVENIFAAQKLPSEIRKVEAEAGEAESKAASAATAAKFAESKAVMDLRMSEEQIKKWAADTDIARQNVKIAAMNAATAREGNSLKRQEMQLKLNEAITERDEKLRTKSAEVESARASMDNMLNTAQRILNTDRKVIENATGPVGSKLPTLREGTADFEALVETLGSQSLMAQIPSMKGTGQLSNAEGDKLQSALQNLSLKQSPDRLVANVKEAVRLIEKARKNVSDKYGVPNTQPDVPAAVNRAITVDY